MPILLEDSKSRGHQRREVSCNFLSSALINAREKAIQVGQRLMDRYVRVEQAKPEQSNITDNEVCATPLYSPRLA